MISRKLSPVNEFPESFKRELFAELAHAARTEQRPLIAAFDADGTLWDTDVGENFFDYQIHHCGLPRMPDDPWAHYNAVKKIEPTTAYVWLAQINKGQRLEQVRAWAKQAVDQLQEKYQGLPVLSSTHELIKELRRLEFEIYVVTASVKWAVEPAAALLGIDQDHVLGITTAVVDGIVTAEPVHPITWRDGKAQALLKATGDRRPVLAAGNTYGDIALIRTATHVRLALATQNEKNHLFEEESRLQNEALSQQWKIHRYR